MSLKAKSNENYDKVNLALEECLKFRECHHSFELGKITWLKDYKRRTVP
jgi:hypothetical protein